LGASDIDERLGMRLVNGIIYSFQEQTTESQVMLDGFQVGTVVNALGKFYDLVQQRLLITLSSDIRVKPYLLQTITTILWRLNNRSAKVCQQVADLTTRLAVDIKQYGEDQQLRTLGLVLLTNLQVQERQSRVCSTVAIAIVCGPFTCIPAILNEYRTAELNVRTGCLKALSFVFEYVGPQPAYYCDSVVTMLEDALTDRDLVHRQTASTIVKHLALGVAGLGCKDSMLHLMNLVWPNCFETSPHVIGAVMDAIDSEAMRVTLEPGVLLSYVLQGLFHPARKVREVYWRISHF
jgi:hypothetical protein